MNNKLKNFFGEITVDDLQIDMGSFASADVTVRGPVSVICYGVVVD